MALSNFDAFRSFAGSLEDIHELAYAACSDYKTALDAHTKDLHPIQASDYARRQLAGVSVDYDLVLLYHSTADFVSSTLGDGGVMEETPACEQVATQARRAGSNDVLLPAAMPKLVEATVQALTEDFKRSVLIRFLEQNDSKVQEQRITQLEHTVRLKSAGSIDTESDDDSPGTKDYTRAQQALAIQLLLTEGMNIWGVDQTKIIALAHLLSGYRPPMQGGKENLGNSGLKTAFAKIRDKRGKPRLADLRFVLPFFEPFEAAPSDGMKRIVAVLKEDIAKTEARLRRAQE